MRSSYLLVISFVGFLVTTSVEAAHLTFTLNAGDYEIVEKENGEQAIRMADFGNLLVPGKPMLPAKVFTIALPPGAEVLSVVITGKDGIELLGTYKIRPAPPPLPANKYHRLIEKSIQEWRENYESTYSSGTAYPEQVGQYLGTSQLRKYTFARVAFFPFVYHPKSGRLFFHPRCNVVISYSIAPRGGVEAEKMQQLLADTVADERASRLLVNFSEAKRWYTSYERKLERQTYNYVIITSEDLQASIFSLVSWKQYLGYSVELVTTTWISNNYSGFDLVEKIRNFLIDKYIEWGIEYVLLVGNVDLIPMRQCFPNADDHAPNSDFCPPTDYYYADLTGNWDSDGDGFYGEYYQDNVDLVPEVIVGRIPWNLGISGICQKLVHFEQDISTWKKNALLLGAPWYYANENHSGIARLDAAELMEEMKDDILSGWTYTTMYEKEGLRPCQYACNLPLTHTNVFGDWSINDYGIVNWGCHGSTTTDWRKLWTWDDGDSVPEDPELYSTPFFNNADVQSLDDDRPSIIFACCCHNAWPEVNSLARKLIKHGSAGIVAATRIGGFLPNAWWDENDGGVESINYYFFHYLINENDRVGDALFDSQVYYLNHFFWWGWKSQETMLVYCLYGDPALVQEGFEVPLVSIYDYEWIDSGEDGYADAGDTLSLTLALLNSGIDASIVVANLSSQDPFITMIDSTSNCGQILSDSIKDTSADPFVLWVNEDAPLHICTLKVAIIADGLGFSDSISIMIGIPPILVIDDDGGDTYETYFTQSLNRIGVLFDLKDRKDVITSSFISDYQALIWLTGNNSSPIDSSDVPALSNYLDSGGNLFISGQDVEGCVDTNFYHNYLHASLVQDSTTPFFVDGVEGDPIGDGLSFVIVGAAGANNQVTPSIISPIGGADSIFNRRFAGCCGVKYGNSYKVVHLSFGFEAINNVSRADTVMMRILKWFDLSAAIEEEVTWQDPAGITQFLKTGPDPFRGELQIECSVRSPSMLELRVYDIAGRMVRELFREPKTPGVYRVKWDGRNSLGARVSQGIYFLHLSDGREDYVKKCVLLR